MKYPFLVLIAFLFFTHSFLHSQEGWHRLTTDDGLSSNVVLSILQAQNGDIWIGTEEGINRYNGVFDDDSLHGSVNSILESPLGQIIARKVVSSNNSSSVRLTLFDGLKWAEPDFFS
jgi:ligand-binding sensor domain-containing protein